MTATLESSLLSLSKFTFFKEKYNYLKYVFS